MLTGNRRSMGQVQRHKMGIRADDLRQNGTSDNTTADNAAGEFNGPPAMLTAVRIMKPELLRLTHTGLITVFFKTVSDSRRQLRRHDRPGDTAVWTKGLYQTLTDKTYHDLGVGDNADIDAHQPHAGRNARRAGRMQSIKNEMTGLHGMHRRHHGIFFLHLADSEGIRVGT